MMTWVLEREVFPDSHDRLAAAARQAGHRVIDWDDPWWTTRAFPTDLDPTRVLFHGSLENADRVARDLDWTPGAPRAELLGHHKESCPSEDSTWHPRKWSWSA